VDKFVKKMSVEGNQGTEPHGPCDIIISYTKEPMADDIMILQQHCQPKSIVRNLVAPSNFPEWQMAFSCLLGKGGIS
jgi:hypothetical protein